MKRKSSTSMGGDGNYGAGGFDEELQSGRHVHVNNNCTIHHHHYYHFHNKANGAEEQTPLKQSDTVKATLSNTDEEQKPIENNLPTQALPINDSPEEKPYVRIQSAANTNYFLSVHDGKLIVSLFDPDDESQHWYLRYIKITDSSGRLCVFLVNKSTGTAVKYSDKDESHLQMVTYNPQVLSRSTLWTLGGGSPCLSPLDYCQYKLEANFNSRGASRDGYPVNIINRTNTCSQSKYDRWEIIDHLEPVVVA